jgi:uncharacterized Zn finger protein (UPF0148 family)
MWCSTCGAEAVKVNGEYYCEECEEFLTAEDALDWADKW